MSKHITLALFILFSSTAVSLSAESHPLVGTWKRVAVRETKTASGRTLRAKLPC